MHPVTVSVLISAPREQVFDYLQDIANHPEFTDHYLVDWHLLREDSVGRGAGARFRVKAPGNRFSWADSTFTEVARPHRLVEVGRTGKTNRIRTLGVYELAPAPGGATRVQFTLETEASVLSDHALMEGIKEGAPGRSARARRGHCAACSSIPPARDRRRPRRARHRRRRINFPPHEPPVDDPALGCLRSCSSPCLP